MKAFPHLCQDGHEPIGFSNGPAEAVESCPVCIALDSAINQLAENTKLRARVEALEYALGKVRALGTVYVYPEGWNCFKAGGMPPIEEYQEVDLSEIGPP